jgi:hypothetical protein
MERNKHASKPNVEHETDLKQLIHDEMESNLMEGFFDNMEQRMSKLFDEKFQIHKDVLSRLADVEDQLGNYIKLHKRKIRIGPIIWTIGAGIAVTTMILMIIYINKHPF